MRDRPKILASLEAAYREAYDAALHRDDAPAMERLDLEFQRDQIQLEVLLDVRDLLAVAAAPGDDEAGATGRVSSLLDHAQALRKLTRLR